MSEPSPVISGHILPTSATMVGVCVTTISLARLIQGGQVGYWEDKLLAGDSVLFVICAALSFAAIRKPHLATKLERHAETLFIMALVLLGVAAVVMACKIR